MIQMLYRKSNTNSESQDTENTICHSSDIIIENKSCPNTLKNRIFQVFHKKEIIPETINKQPSSLIRCTYCDVKFFNIHRFETHTRIHVSNFFFNLFFFRPEKDHINAHFV